MIPSMVQIEKQCQTGMQVSSPSAAILDPYKLHILFLKCSKICFPLHGL